jgi:hypothetical protein
MIDLAGILAARLRAEPAVMTAFSDRVFADVAPPDTDGMFVVVRMSAMEPSFYDVSSWQSVAVLIDIVGDPDNMQALHDGAGLVRTVLATMRGTVAAEVAIQAVEPISGVFGYDPSYTPALPRWVLTASMVVRSITPEEGVVA